MGNRESNTKTASGIRSSIAVTPDGQPISINRAPAADLRPWIARSYATTVATDKNTEVACGILADTPILRILVGGTGHIITRDGPATYTNRALFFGPQTKRMPVRLSGVFRSVAVALKPGVLKILGGPDAVDCADRVIPYADLGWDEESLLARFDPGGDPNVWVDTLEDCFRKMVEQAGRPTPDPMTTAFDHASFKDPSLPIKTFAQDHGVTVRQVERVVKREFGTTPKRVMRRARALDMAANLRGVADQAEAEELALRYFDQSHINRDFLDFFDMSPIRFVRTPQPLMTMTLEARQARRLEMLDRIEEGGTRPWMQGDPQQVHDEQSSMMNDFAPEASTPTGETPDGVPLSLNRPPAEDLEPWLGRIMVAIAHESNNGVVAGSLCNDAAYMRTAIGSDWTAGTIDGTLELRDESFLCGQHTKAMPLTYKGGIQVAGFMLRPGAVRALWGADDGKLLDRIVPTDHVGILDGDLTGLHHSGIEPEAWLLAIEDWLRCYIRDNNIKPPEQISQRFEIAAFADPNQSISEFADENGCTLRTLQRIVKRDFGLTPKQVMRRARTLDLAARLCGVADEEEVDIELRFFDQSHLNREFIAFFGMTPQQFVADRQALLTLSLEIRQARRLELLDRIDPGAVRPWMRKTLLPKRAA